jgi:cytochrome c oxidase cbb3-type subunit 1
MDTFSKHFVKASLTWFGLGATLGVCMAIDPALIIYRPAHLHMNLLGFVTMMIYGVAYHVMPRFTGHPLHSPRLAMTQWWLSNAGLAIMVCGFAITPHRASPGVLLLAAGGVLGAAGAYGFIFNIWRTLDGRAAPRSHAGAPDVIAMRRGVRVPPASKGA